ncbi:abortive infection family protein [Paenibacillus sp. FSL R7-277]|uniref:abortive infection family protein n=1 Tax=Paenibacillus sp. FSL R7-277 TaxID=1227352 RepID=UPI001F47C78D|nr:abortive infection family protein [Paenibacillus sp. FSL R7-277]
MTTCIIQEIVEPLKQVITGLASTVQGLGTTRNVVSDSHSRKYEPDAHHAILVVNASKTVASFMFGTFQYRQVKGILKKEVKQPN